MKKIITLTFIIFASSNIYSAEFIDYTDYINIKNIYAKQNIGGKIEPLYDCRKDDLSDFKKFICNSYNLPSLENFFETYHKYIVFNLQNDAKDIFEKIYISITNNAKLCMLNKQTEDEKTECIENIYLDGVHEINLMLRYFSDGRYFKLYKNIFLKTPLNSEPTDFLSTLSTLGTVNIDGTIKKIYKSKFTPSFECKKASTVDEKTVCYSDYLLPVLDRFFTQYYSYSLNNVYPQDKNKVKEIAVDMMKNRAKCKAGSDKSIALCIRYNYSNAINKLNIFLSSFNNGQYLPIYAKIFGTETLVSEESIRSFLFFDRLPDVNSDGTINLN